MTAAHENPPTTKQKLSLTPQQASSWLLIEHCITCLQSAMNQTGGFLGQTDAGDALGEAQALLGKRRDELLAKWNRKVQLAPAGVIIDGTATKVH